MTAIVVGMVFIVVVALVVLSVFSEKDEDWSRPKADDPGKATLDALLNHRSDDRPDDHLEK